MKKKRFLQRLSAVLTMLALLLSMCGGMALAADDTSAVVDAANGVARLFVVLTKSGWIDDGAGTLTAVTINVGFATGTAFGIGAVGEETDTFVTNRHVVTSDEYEVSEIWLLLDSRAATYSYSYDYYYDADGNLTGYEPNLEYDIDTSLAVRCDIEYVSEDEYPDVAIVKARQTVSGRTALALYDADEYGDMSPTDSVWAIGYPGDSDQITVEETVTGVSYTLAADVSDATVTEGTISRITNIASYDNTEVIQHTASISHGNSGGPLVNADGAVIGINTYGISGDETDYYAVDIEYVIEICDENDIPYEIWEPEDDSLPVGLIIAIAAAVAVVIVVIVLLATRKKKTDSAQQPQPGPAPTPAPQPVVQQPVQRSIPGDSGFRIQATSGVFAGRRYAIVNQIRLGRDPEKNDVVYPAGTKGISGVHCVVAVTNGQITLMDLGSTYGTYLAQGQRIAANQPVVLQVGDTFSLGSSAETFVITRKGGV